MTTLIAAVARNGVIGHQNTIPWHLPEDFAHFKAVTLGQTVIMGSRTWESLPKRPLAGRLNIVVSRKRGSEKPFGLEDTLFVNSLNEAEYLASVLYPEREIFVIGGASIYEQAIGNDSRLIISEVDDEPTGDTFFPHIGSEWVEVTREPRGGFSVVEYVKLG